MRLWASVHGRPKTHINHRSTLTVQYSRWVRFFRYLPNVFQGLGHLSGWGSYSPTKKRISNFWYIIFARLYKPMYSCFHVLHASKLLGSVQKKLFSFYSSVSLIFPKSIFDFLIFKARGFHAFRVWFEQYFTLRVDRFQICPIAKCSFKK